MLTAQRAQRAHDRRRDDAGGGDQRLAHGRGRARRGRTGEADEATEAALATLATRLDTLDVVSAALDGLREQLLGLPVPATALARRTPVPGRRPAGAARARRAPRHQGARSSTRSAACSTCRTRPAPGLPARDEVAEPTPALRLRPRLTVPARWLFRLVDPAGTGRGRGGGARRPGRSGAGGQSGRRVPAARSHRRGARGLRRRRHAARPADARAVRRRRRLGDRARAAPVPADAGPLDGLRPAAADRRPPRRRARRRGRGRARRALPARPEAESALSGAAARDRHDAVDGRHVRRARQRAHRRPRRPADRRRPRAAVARRRDRPRRVDLSDPQKRAAASRPTADLAALSFPVRLGELTRDRRRPARLLRRRRLRALPRRRQGRREPTRSTAAAARASSARYGTTPAMLDHVADHAPVRRRRGRAALSTRGRRSR